MKDNKKTTIDEMNKDLEQGKVVKSDTSILQDTTEKDIEVDAITNPTLKRIYATKKFLEQLGDKKTDE
ncbi:MAG: hypothetical protein GX958_03165 [Desulfitobacterium sp.]|nr:hypothetical protein [Desulfitobacterium sp.]